MKPHSLKTKINWAGGRNGKGYITDYRPARKGSATPTIGTALYVALSKGGECILWSERRAMPQSEASEKGLIQP
jgi:hypothetical protein